MLTELFTHFYLLPPHRLRFSRTWLKVPCFSSCTEDGFLVIL